MSVENKTTEERLPWAELEKIIPAICTRETAYRAKDWNPENPTKDHCTVVSMLVKKLYGGQIMRASLEGTEFAKSRFHYRNHTLLRVIDLTASQFGDKYPEGLDYEEKTYKYLMSIDSVARRFTKLVLNYNKYLSGENPLFNDAIYQKCISNALASPCQKMGFGAVLKKDGKIVAEANNHEIPELAYMCERFCIRGAIKSRTESMIGACGHAEEFVMKKGRDMGVDLTKCDLYVAGVYDNAKLYIKKEPEHTCLRCAVQMNYAELKSIQVPVSTGWAGITPSEALTTAARYAVGEKRV